MRFGWVLWHIKHCWLFNEKSPFYIHIKYIGFTLVQFYGISTIVSCSHVQIVFLKFTSCDNQALVGCIPIPAGIIKIDQSSHKMYSNNIVNFQESTTNLNASTKIVWKLIEGTTYIYACVCVCRQKISIFFNEIFINEEMLPKHTHTYIYIYIYLKNVHNRKMYNNSRIKLIVSVLLLKLLVM